jgi:hypothetical protein
MLVRVIEVLAFANCLVLLLLLPVPYMCDIRGTHSGTVESTRLVGHCAVYIGTEVPTFRRSLLYCALE